MGWNFEDGGGDLDIRRVAVFEHSSDWTWRRSGAGDFNLWLALEGSGKLVHEGQIWPFSAGSLFLLPPDLRTEGRGEVGQRVTNFTMHVGASNAVASRLEQLGRGGSPVRLRQVAWAAGLARHLSEAFYFGGQESRGVVIAGLHLLLSEMAAGRVDRVGGREDDDLMGIVERIRRNPASAYSVDELAALVGLSSSQFTRRFRALTGMAPNRFIVEERLARADSYLRETRLSVQEIAARLGYRDGYFFSRQFRRFRGMTPTAARGREG